MSGGGHALTHDCRREGTCAARLVEHGHALSVEEVEIGEPGVGELLVELAYAGVNPVDRYQVLGRVGADAPLPRTLGSEAAGTVVSGGDPGRRVFVNRAAVAHVVDGLWASHALVEADKVIDVPEVVGLDVAAAAGVVGATAWRCVTEWAEVSRDDRVLVLGAAGGVGSAIVSLCARLGADVVGQVGTQAKEAFAAERGATRVVVAGAGDLLPALEGFSPTTVFDPLGDGFTASAIEAMAPTGRLVLFGTSAGDRGELPLQALYRKGLSVLGYGGLLELEEAIRRGVRESLAALAEGRMEIVVGDRVPLASVNDALARIANREVQGKLVLDCRA
jgi:NADPH2:quinone reductase